MSKEATARSAISRERAMKLAREAGVEFTYDPTETPPKTFVECWMEELQAFAELVRADERKSRAHSLDPGEMELSLRRNHKDELFECRRRFSAEGVMHGPDFMVEATASNLEVEMDRAIQEWSNS